MADVDAKQHVRSRPAKRQSTLSQPSFLLDPHTIAMSGFSAARRAISRLDVTKATLFVCDMQDKFRPLIYNMETAINRSALCISVCKELSVPMIVTQQYTKVFGPSVPELASVFPASLPIYDKTRFSMLTPECSTAFAAMNREQVLVIGIEAHVCVMQTVLDLLELGKEVHVVTDAVSSQRAHDRAIAMQRMESAGAVLTTSESAIFDLLRDSKHPQFRVCSALVKHHSSIGTWEAGV